MAIRVLNQHTAELIAAGEVVERPSSVVKELCENAIDAGAKSISVEIEKGGISLISIQDNGSGIATEDIPLAFVRHATSKVSTEADLEHIMTLGFRGEALASIASVAQVELLTRTAEDEFAATYRIEGGQEIGLEAAARPLGTTINVRNLFYNTPARMKFLKKDSSEGTFVTETVTRLALSHPEVAFHYVKDGKKVFSTQGDGNLQAAAWAILGADFARQLLCVEGKSKQYEVSGFVTSPLHARASRAMQYFFINGRFVKNRTMMAALEQAYRGMTMHGKFPGCLLFLKMPPELVDVNVHPAKTEVRFSRESDVFEAVYSAVKSALLQSLSLHASLQFSESEQIEKTVPEEMPAAPRTPPVQTIAAATDPSFPAPNLPPTGARIKAYNEMVDTLASESAYAPYETFVKASTATLDVSPAEQEPLTEAVDTVQQVPEQTTFAPAQMPEGEPLRFVGEVFKTYILAQLGEVLCVIDKHAAHERILYERLVENRQAPDSQQLLSPVPVALSATEKSALLQNEDSLRQAGLEIEDFGGNNIIVRGIPTDVEPDDVASLAVEIADRLTKNGKDTTSEKTQWVLHSISCRAAIKAGDKTHPDELLRLAGDILNGKVPPFCPHGRPVVLEITRKELERQFGRLG